MKNPAAWALAFAFALPAFPGPLVPSANWTRQVLDTRFLCEGISTADFNRDGKPDIVAGPYWYEGPGFNLRHEIHPPQAFPPIQDSYSNCDFDFPFDFNADGWTDVFVGDRPGRAGGWYQNPGAKGGTWVFHPALGAVDGETPMLADVYGDHAPELLMVNQGHVGWGYPDPANPMAPWLRYSISPPGTWGPNTHGMGLGDVNGDGRKDILMSKSWWEQPAQKNGTWIEHDFDFTPGADGGAQMVALDLDGDGDADIITSLDAHGFGLAWYEQVKTGGGIGWIQHKIFGTRAEESVYGVAFSQLHALAVADVNGDGLPDIIAGKRWGTHGHPPQDVELTGTPVLYAFLISRTHTGPRFTPTLIDTVSGVGTQVTAVDLDGDGRAEILTATRKGIFLYRYRGPVSDLAPAQKSQASPKDGKIDFLGRSQVGWKSRRMKVFLPVPFP